MSKFIYTEEEISYLVIVEAEEPEPEPEEGTEETEEET